MTNIANYLTLEWEHIFGLASWTWAKTIQALFNRKLNKKLATDLHAGVKMHPTSMSGTPPKSLWNCRTQL
jgi:hypothetical protein